MLEREIWIAELWKRLNEVEGVNRTTRNPAAPPTIDDFPIIQFFELEDVVLDSGNRGGYPIYKRKTELVVEAFITASEEALSSKELGEFVQEMKKKIYEGGPNLAKKCSHIIEKDSSRILRPPVGDNSVGVSIKFDVLYIENIANLYS